MSLLRKWFGPSRAEIWRRLSEEIGANYEPGTFSRSDRVDVSHEEWTISLDAYFDAATKHTYTRLRAPYINPDGFTFVIYRHGLFSDLGKRLGMQDVEVDFKEFDEAFVIKGNDESKIRALFADKAVREQLSAQPNVRLSIDTDGKWFRDSFPPRTDTLTFMVSGVIKDTARLEQLFALMAVTLDRLCEMGSAYAMRPRE